MEGMMDELYREVILDHFQSPRHKGTSGDATVVAEGKNPLCGDELTLYLVVDGDQVKQVFWDGQGCSICMASASMLAEQMAGKPLRAAEAMIQAVVSMMHGNELPGDLDMGDIEVLQGVSKFPVRIKCALLPWTTLQEGIKNYDRDESNKRVAFSY